MPAPTEQLDIKHRCADAILDLIPPVIARRFFAIGSSPAALPTSGAGDGERQIMLAEIEAVLDVFGDSYMNKHLVFGIVELCVVRLMPEVGEMSVRELMEARLGEGWEDAE